VRISFTWMEGDRKRDPDGIAAGGTKIILDALVRCGVLRSDRHEGVCGLFHHFAFVQTKDAGVVVEIDPPNAFGGAGTSFMFPHRLPDLNELLRARELGARRSLRRGR